VEARQLLRRIGRGRIDRGAGLGDDDFRQLQLGMALDELGGEPVRLARGGAVADGDELDLVRGGELREGRDRLVPAALRLVREDRTRVYDLPGAVDDRALDPGAVAGIEPQGRAWSGRRGEQQVAQITGEDLHRLLLRRLPEPQAQIGVDVDQDL